MKIKVAALVAVVFLGTAVVSAQTKISGTSTCAKPETHNSLEVGDRPGHTYNIDALKCKWTKPLELGGATTSGEDAITAFAEVRGNNASNHGIVVSAMSNGDKAFVSYKGKSTMKDGAPVTAEGTWSYTGGTGKFTRLKGKGTYKGTAAADGSMTYEVEGEYELPAAAPAKKEMKK